MSGAVLRNAMSQESANAARNAAMPAAGKKLQHTLLGCALCGDAIWLWSRAKQASMFAVLGGTEQGGSDGTSNQQ
jgi:hypothetical protein